MHKRGVSKLSTLYENRRRYCDEAGISGARLCLDTGVSKSTLTSLKTGRTKTIGTENLQKFADRLGVTIDDLLGTEQKEKPAPNGNGLSEEEIKFIEWYRSQASEKDKALVRMIVEGE